MGPTWKCVAFSNVPHLWQPTCGPIITYCPNMGNTDGNHAWVSCWSHAGPLRGKTYGYHVENYCILQCAPLVAAHVWAHDGNHALAPHGQYGWQTLMGFMWVPCGSFERQNTWVPRRKLLHTPVCPISGSPRVAHERHTRGSFIGPVDFCYLGTLSLLLQIFSSNGMVHMNIRNTQIIRNTWIGLHIFSQR